jgi:hypothetical protein
MSWQHERARVASLSRDRAADDPELLDARRNLRAERLATRLSQLAAEAAAAAPDLTHEQRSRLARLVRPVLDAAAS